VTSSASFLVLAGASFFALVAIFVVSIVIGVMRRRAGFQLSSEIEQAAGMEDRWRPRGRTVTGGKGDHAAA
jgi:hypothetical protein